VQLDYLYNQSEINAVMASAGEDSAQKTSHEVFISKQTGREEVWFPKKGFTQRLFSVSKVKYNCLAKRFCSSNLL